MALKRGFVNIPVGDYKPSRLMEHPHLCVVGACCDINFRQSEEKNLCVTKSLASAFYAMGWHDEAFKIDAFDEEILHGAVVEGIDRVGTYTTKIFPTWVVVRLLSKEFDYQADLQENNVVLGALLTSNGICSHAITIHGSGFIDVFCIHYRGLSTLSNWIWVLPIVHLILESYFLDAIWVQNVHLKPKYPLTLTLNKIPFHMFFLFLTTSTRNSICVSQSRF